MFVKIFEMHKPSFWIVDAQIFVCLFVFKFFFSCYDGIKAKSSRLFNLITMLILIWTMHMVCLNMTSFKMLEGPIG